MSADASALQTAVQGVVAYKVNGSVYANATGLSIYFPSAAAYYVSAVYDPLPGMDSWRMFLRAYYGAGAAAIVPAFARATYNATSTAVTLDGILTAGSLPNVTTATLVYGLPGGTGDAWLYGDQPALTSTDLNGDHVRSTWDYSFLHLTQTTPSAHDEYGYVSIRKANATIGIIFVPMSYYPPSSSVAQFAVREIVFEIGTGTLLADVYYVGTSGVLGQLTPAAGSTMHALVGHLPTAGLWSSGWVNYTATGAFDATTPINLQFITLGTGARFFAGLLATNAGGQGGWVATPVSPAPTKP